MVRQKNLTLTFIINGDKILLGLKKRGFGLGRYNGFGGKIEEGESIEEAAAREVFEESNLAVNSLEKIGRLNFTFDYNSEDLLVHVFKTSNFSGQAEESAEMKPQWFDIKNIPYKKMWPDDIYWLPLILDNKKIQASFLFGKKDKIVKQSISIVEQL